MIDRITYDGFAVMRGKVDSADFHHVDHVYPVKNYCIVGLLHPVIS